MSTAGQICEEIQPEGKKCRAISNVFAAKVANEYFDDEDCDIQSGLHNSASVLKDIDISDIYLKNSYIDVRLHFDDNDLCVPKVHFEYDLLPIAYMFIKIDRELRQGEVQGFITPSAVDRNTEINGYYRVSEKSLVPFYDIEDLLNAPNQDDVDLETEIQIYDFLDGKIENKAEFYKRLIESRENRLFLLKADSTKYVMSHLPKTAVASGDEISDFAGDFVQQEALEELMPAASDDDLNESLPEADITDDLLKEAPAEELISDTDDELVFADDTEKTIELDMTSGAEPLEITEEPSTESAIPEQGDVINDLYTEEKLENAADIAIDTLDNEINSLEDAEEVIPENDEPDTGITDSEAPVYEEAEPDITSQEISETAEADNSETETEHDTDFSTEVTPSLAFLDEENADAEAAAPEDAPQDLDQLFTQGEAEESIPQGYDNNIQKQQGKKSGSVLKGLLVIALLAGIGYFGYTKYTQSQMPSQDTIPQEETADSADNNPSPDAMPIETIENHADVSAKNEGNSIDVPEIEKNLDASILVSNLAVSWDVPTAYLTNTSAKRYFTKIGKILQLQLKTELLLSSKPPLNNRIVVELEYNKDANAFSIKGISTSSGEKSIDSIVTKTIEKVLKTDLSINTSSFANIQGNPLLIIKL